ncbi:MAG TPA: cobalt-precorrin-6A reductase [Acidobacteriaceae bacterium]|jgi:precorrin-6A/cobalt-precorrin-6A reductase
MNESSTQPPRILILGGTSEGVTLAARLAHRTDLSILSSLAGRVASPKLPEGPVRIGGFGGLDALAAFLIAENIAAVIDATHPFAATISRNAETACNRTGIPLLALTRPSWKKLEGDQWHEVPDFATAASFVNQHYARVFLSIGRQEVSAFSERNNPWFLIRSIEAPEAPLPPQYTLILARGPFALEDELALLREHHIDCIVSKNSGGLATYGKVEAARALRLPVVMIQRPHKHTITPCETVDEVLAQFAQLVR